MKRILVVLAVVLSLFAGCNGNASVTPPTSTGMPGTEITLSNGSYWRITPTQLASQKRAELFLVCVDEQPSLVISNSTELFVKYNEISQSLSLFPANKDQMIVAYCIAGVTSQTASEALVSAGYTRVMHLEGGTLRWQQAGYQAHPVTT
jgi:rhodanese-related sulfurtransferase